MNLADTLRALWRRWYVVVPGLILSIAVAIGAWQVIEPDYERVGTQLLLPGVASIPEAGNPYLYLGGLSQASDVVVTAMSSERELEALVRDYPGAEIVITRDPVTSGPQILTTVTAKSDADAGKILAATMDRTTEVLGNLQNVSGITARNRIGIESITVDSRSTLVQKSRLLVAGGATLGMLLITLLSAGLVEGLGSRKRRERKADVKHGDSTEGAPTERENLQTRAGTRRDRRASRQSLSRRSRYLRRSR
ncbi:hypothetical protein [Salinibacterium sp. M195]|uniref:hypothetical protein n=1 Tax=Salinibacterium sp. M195 TaxID=2583374 RepID=UPI001C63B5FD|nr:hypothetical protein [Salinibacterium sp. M195]QYH36952.1 hypothetical protein FFT87_13995 [Salinibacterium sp. M195]